MMSSLFRPLKRVSKRFGGCRNFSVVLVSLTVIGFTLKTFWTGKDVDIPMEDKYETESVVTMTMVNLEKDPLKHDIFKHIGLDSNSYKTVEKVLSNNTQAVSYCASQCAAGQFSYSIVSGHLSPDKNVGPTGPVICFQGEIVMSPELKNVQRGINMVVVDSKTGNIKKIMNFDTYISESGFVKFLKTKVLYSDIILIATLDEAATGLKNSARQYLQYFGSKLIKSLGFRENFVMIGHKGLALGSALEAHKAKPKKQVFGNAVEHKGCFKFPIGNVKNIDNQTSPVLRGKNIKVGERHDNCGLPAPCPAEHVAVAVDTGYGNSNTPKICINGFVRMDRKTNGAGRGFNMVALDPETLQPAEATHVDTYESDSTDLEIFLDDLRNGSLVVGVIADEASTKHLSRKQAHQAFLRSYHRSMKKGHHDGLDQMARDLLNKFGSGMIQNLRFRDVWYFVGQKGLLGFSKFEELSYAPFGGGWPKRLNNKFCIPKKLPVLKTVPDPVVTRNDQRRGFCTKYEGYTDFCNPEFVDETLQAVPVYAKELKGHKIFDIPIIIVPGMNHNAFVNTLQTTRMQPGIKPELVSVLWDEKLPEYKELAGLFGFHEYVLDSSVSYAEQMNKAMKSASIVFPQASHMIFIEEDLLLAPDFLPFMAHCMDVMGKDESLVGASAWNFNGFENVSGKADAIYRVQDFPGLGFLLKMTALNRLVDSWGSCCHKRAWIGWQLSIVGKEMLVPDVSRVYRTPLFGALASSNLARDLFLKPRKTHLEAHPTAVDIKSLQATEYEKFLNLQIKNAYVLPPTTVELCVDGKASAPSLKESMGAVVLYYQQYNATDYSLLRRVCRCFGLVSLEQDDPKNLHNGMLRFFYEKKDVFLIGTASPYYDREKHNDVLVDPELFNS